jgi:hypothetical protein
MLCPLFWFRLSAERIAIQIIAIEAGNTWTTARFDSKKSIFRWF